MSDEMWFDTLVTKTLRGDDQIEVFKVLNDYEGIVYWI